VGSITTEENLPPLLFTVIDCFDEDDITGIELCLRFDDPARVLIPSNPVTVDTVDLRDNAGELERGLFLENSIGETLEVHT
jgi:hypothetical protein